VDAAIDQFVAFIGAERDNCVRRARSAALFSILILALLYRTEWTILRPGLAILLIGQLGVAVAYVVQAVRISRDSSVIYTWFDRQRSFIRRVAWFEACCHWAGFAVLGYGLWRASASWSLGVALGIVYPAAAYFGINRRRNANATRRLTVKEEQIVLIFLEQQ
jgi:hypothetical protein